MDKDKLARIGVIVLITGYILYVLYEMYSRYQENCRREQLAKSDLEFNAAMITSLKKSAEQPALRPQMEFRYPWEKRKK